MSHLEEIYQAVLDGDAQAAQSGVSAALAAGVAPGAILQEALIGSMGEVGRRFEAREYFVPEMLVSARAMQFGLAVLKPHLADGGAVAAGRLVIGTDAGSLYCFGTK